MIVNLKVTNFKGVESAEINCDKVTLFVGLNRAGKTSMLNAAGWCIFGGNRPSYVRNTKDEARVVAHTERAIFDRSLVRGAKKDKIIVTKKSDGSVVESSKALGSFNENCFNPINFIFLPPKDQSKYVRAALADKVSFKDDNEAKDLGINLFEEDGTRSSKDAKTLCDLFYKKYYDERTEINRQLDTMHKKMASAKLDFIPDKAFLDTLSEQVKTLESRLNEQVKKNARIKAAQQNEVTRQKLQDQITKLDEEIENVPPVESDLSQDLPKLEKEFQESSSREADIRGSFNAISRTLTELETSQYPICPISKKISCKTDMSSVREEMKREQVELEERLRELHTFNVDLKNRIDAIREKVNIHKSLTSKMTERDRARAMFDSLNTGNETPEDEDATKGLLEAKRQELATATVARELADLGDIEEKQKRQHYLNDTVKKIREFIDVELTKRSRLDIPDIEVREDGIYFRNLPLVDECTSVQLRAACVIMKSLYPKSKLILADRLEVLDPKTLAQFLKTYVDDPNGVQLFGTYVAHVNKDGEPDYSSLKIPGVKLIEMKAGVPNAVS